MLGGGEGGRGGGRDGRRDRGQKRQGEVEGQRQTDHERSNRWMERARARERECGFTLLFKLDDLIMTIINAN